MFNSSTSMPSLLKIWSKKLAIALVALALAIVAWGNLLFHLNINANAAIITPTSPIVAIEGIGDKIEGKIEKDTGTVQRNVGKVTGQAEGALKQAKGEVKQDIGEVKNKLDNAKDKAEDKTENWLDSVKNFFN